MLGGWVIVLLGLAVSQGAGALTLVVIARRVAPELYGQYLASYGLVSLLLTFAGLGLDQWLLTRNAPSGARVVGLWRGAMRQRIRLLLLWLPAVALLSLLLPNDRFPPGLVAISAIGLVADSLSALAHVALRRLSMHRSVTLFQIAGALTLLGGTLIFPFGPDQLLGFALYRTLISMAIALASLGWMMAVARGYARSEGGKVSVREAGPFFAAEIAVATYMRADLIIVNVVLGTESAGVYGIALCLVNMCFLAPYALYLLVTPNLARQFRSSSQLYWRLGRRQMIAQGVIGILTATALFVFSPALIGLLFGAEYLASAEVVRLLSPLLVFKSLSFGFGALLSTAGQQVRRTGVQIAVAAFNVLMNLMVVARWGVNGVAITYVLSELLLCAGYLLVFVKWRRDLYSKGSTP